MADEAKGTEHLHHARPDDAAGRNPLAPPTQDLPFVLGAWCVSRLLVYGSILSSNASLPTALESWDASWILEIARTGYQNPPQAAFFPAFPEAVSFASRLVGSPLLVALFLNTFFSMAGSALLYRLARTQLPRHAARLAVLVLLFHPLSFYLTVPYTEALFFTASVGAFWLAESGSTVSAGLLGATAALTRNTGVLLALPLSSLGFRPVETKAEPPRNSWTRAAILAFFPLAGLAGYMLFTSIRFGDPLLLLHAQEHWRDHIQLSWPFAALFRDVGRWRAWVDHHLPLSLIGLVLAYRVWTRWPRAYGLLVAPPLLLSFSLSKLAITPRLHFVLFPLWLEAGAWLAEAPRWVQATVLGVAAALGVVLARSFAVGIWVD
jgi:hypothetical protein